MTASLVDPCHLKNKLENHLPHHFILLLLLFLIYTFLYPSYLFVFLDSHKKKSKYFSFNRFWRFRCIFKNCFVCVLTRFFCVSLISTSTNSTLTHLKTIWHVPHTVLDPTSSIIFPFPVWVASAHTHTHTHNPGWQSGLATHTGA